MNLMLSLYIITEVTQTFAHPLTQFIQSILIKVLPSLYACVFYKLLPNLLHMNPLDLYIFILFIFYAILFTLHLCSHCLCNFIFLFMSLYRDIRILQPLPRATASFKVIPHAYIYYHFFICIECIHKP